jgi:23S rRNA pseudouridine2605 synthase
MEYPSGNEQESSFEQREGSGQAAKQGAEQARFNDNIGNEAGSTLEQDQQPRSSEAPAKRPRMPYRSDSSSKADFRSNGQDDFASKNPDYQQGAGYYSTRTGYGDTRGNTPGTYRQPNYNTDRQPRDYQGNYGNERQPKDYQNRPGSYRPGGADRQPRDYQGNYGNERQPRDYQGNYGNERQPKDYQNRPGSYRPGGADRQPRDYQGNYSNERQPRDYQNRPYRSNNNDAQGNQPRSGGYEQRGNYGSGGGAGRQYDNRQQGGGGYEQRGNYGGGGAGRQYDNRQQGGGGYEQRGNYGGGAGRQQYERRYRQDDPGAGGGYQQRRPSAGGYQQRGPAQYGDERRMRPNYDNRQQSGRANEGRVMRPRTQSSGPQQNYRSEQPYDSVLKPVSLIKALSRCDYGSPRICLKAIRDGHVTVNGEVITNPNLRIRTQRDILAIKGIPVDQKLETTYIVMNKGRHYAGSNEGKSPTSVYRLLRHKLGWFFPFGCLERSSNGIIIITNDINCKRTYGAELMNLPKAYRIKVHRPLQSIEEVTRIQDFVRTQTEEHLTVTLDRANTRSCWLRFDVRTASPTDIRTALKEYGLETLAFERTALGFLNTQEFHPGSWRRLEAHEIDQLLRMASLEIEPYEVPDDLVVVPPASPVRKADIPDKAAWRKIYRQWYEALNNALQQ